MPVGVSDDRELLYSGQSTAALIPQLRRFGKTMNMSMITEFFDTIKQYL